MKKLDEQTLKATLQQGIRASRAYDNSEHAHKRQRQLEYYQGKLTDVKALEGRSSVIDTTVSDTIGWTLPAIMRVFAASDVMVDYEPTNQNDEEAAKQASEYINFVFMKDNDGYRNLYDGTFNSLLHGNGIVKHWWDDTEDFETTQHTGMSLEQIQMFEQDEDVEILAASSADDDVVIVQNPETGEQYEETIPTFDVKLKRTISHGGAKIIIIPNEDFLIDEMATTIEDSRFCGHREETTRSELIKRGFDKAKVDAIPAYDASRSSLDDLARDIDEEQLFDEFDEPSMEKITVTECYIKIDADGDGVAEIVRAYMAGNDEGSELLDWEVWEDEMPFSDIPCSPMPHRFVARSYADDTMEPARIKTSLLRQGLDSFYASNLPMREVEEGSVKNMNALTNPKFGGIVIRKRGSAPTQPIEIPNTAADAFNALNYIDETVEKRTGVTRSSMALDPETLQNQSATANQNAKDASYSKVELLARNMAELGWKRVFNALLKIIVKNQDRERTIRLRDEWVKMDPRHWNANMDATVNTGLGTGSRDRDMAMMNQILQQQIGMAERMAAGGFPDLAVDMAQRIQRTSVKLAESAGIKNPDEYFPEVTDEMVMAAKERLQQMQSQPSPEQQKLQVEQQALERKHEMDMQQAQMQADVARDKEQAQMQADLVVNQAKQEIEQMKLEMEAAIARMQDQTKRDIEFAKLGMKQAEEGGEIVSREDERNGAFLGALSQISGMIQNMQLNADAPKRIVKDENGDVIGVETIRPEEMN